MTPPNEANASLLIYAIFVTVAAGVLAWRIYKSEERRRRQMKRHDEQMDRRDFLMDQAALRLREFTLLMEELWQMKK